MRRSNPPEFRRRVLDLVESGRKGAEVARLLGISDQTIYNWRRQHLADTGQVVGTTSADQAELSTALFEYLEIFHNRQRRHSALEMLTLVEYELRAAPAA